MEYIESSIKILTKVVKSVVKRVSNPEPVLPIIKPTHPLEDIIVDKFESMV